MGSQSGPRGAGVASTRERRMLLVHAARGHAESTLIAAPDDLADTLVDLLRASGPTAAIVDEVARRRQDANSIVALLPTGAPPEAVAEALRAGADDAILAADADARESLVAAVGRLASRARRCAELEGVGGLTGTSRAIESVRSLLAEALDEPALPVLLLGETGTGKCRAARALHRVDARRAEETFHTLDCGSTVPELFGSELFGHVHGAFTGASSTRAGAIATAGEGTLFLDEVGELDAGVQASLLTALQEREYRPVGTDRVYPVRCRIVAATNRDLLSAVSDGRFRSDLWYRLDGLRVVLPPLRDRRDDVVPLFVAVLARALGPHARPRLDADVAERLLAHDYPGNVRELETIARHCARRCDPSGRVRAPHLPRTVGTTTPATPSDGARAWVHELLEGGSTLDEIRAACDAEATRAALEIADRAGLAVRPTERVERVAAQLRVCERTAWTLVKRVSRRS